MELQFCAIKLVNIGDATSLSSDDEQISVILQNILQ